MCKLFSILTVATFFFICSPQIFACTCLTPSLEDRIYQSPIIVLAKIKNVMAKPAVNDVELGSVTLSDLRILKGTTSSSEIFVPEFRYGDCICSIEHTRKTIKELEGTTMIVFLNEEGRELDFIAHKNEKDYEDLSQRITEMVTLQKQSDWKKDEHLFEWYATCMISDATWGYVYFQFLEPRDGTGTGLAYIHEGSRSFQPIVFRFDRMFVKKEFFDGKHNIKIKS